MAEQYCTFFLKDQMFGVPVQRVQEVIRSQQMTRVPLVPNVVRGLINLRGQIVMALDLRRRLGMEELPRDFEPLNVIVRTLEGPVGLLVDSIGEVVEVEEKAFEPLPQMLSQNACRLVCGVHKLEVGLMHVLDTEKVCESLDSTTAICPGKNQP